MAASAPQTPPGPFPPLAKVFGPTLPFGKARPSPAPQPFEGWGRPL